MLPVAYFPADYRNGRAAFRAAAAAAGARLASYMAPSTGPDGKPLHTDVAVIGAEDAPHVLVCNSATHGVEGFCGSGVFTGWFDSGGGARLPDSVKVVLIHALNCHGFAWLRRVTEENVDLNRNFIDHSATLPANAGYRQFHPLLLPDRWDDQSTAPMIAAFERYSARQSPYRLQCILTAGQYEYEDGIFYGGRQETTARRRFLEIIDTHASGADHLLFLDWHTGLGEYGSAELIGQTRPGSAHGDRVSKWFVTGLTSTRDGTSSSAPVSGTIGSGLRRRLAAAPTEVTSLTVEFGTYPPREVLMPIIADNWLHLLGDPASGTGRSIKADIRRALYPDQDDWKELVWMRGREIMNQAIAGLGSL